MKPRKVILPSLFSGGQAIGILKSLAKISGKYKSIEYTAQRLGVSVRTLADWRSGKSKPPDTLLILILYHIQMDKNTPKEVKEKISEFDRAFYMPISPDSNFELFINAIS